MDHVRAIDSFVEEFYDSERSVVRAILLQLDDLARRVNKSTATHSNPVELYLDLDSDSGSRASAVLRLSSAHTKPCSVFWLFPSAGHARNRSRNAIEVNPNTLRESGVKESEISAFQQALARSEFTCIKNNWITTTANTEDGLSRIFGYSANLQSFLAGIDGLARSIAAYTS